MLLQSLDEFISILSSAVNIFHNVEAIAFYAGFIFGVLWVIKQIIKPQKKPDIPTAEETAEVLLKPLDDDSTKPTDSQAGTIESTMKEGDIEEFQRENDSFV
jgi:hypothetical protein